MKKLKDSFIKFMVGRYGPDTFYKFLIILYFAILILNIFLKSSILSFLGLIIFIYAFYRFFSKNIYKRQQENLKYWNIREKVRKFFNRQKNRVKYRNTYIYKKCPNCKVFIKLPKIKGTLECKCPKCSNKFKVKVR